MAGSGILSRLSSTRLPSLSVKLRTKKSVMSTISPLKSSSQPQGSSSMKRISRWNLSQSVPNNQCLVCEKMQAKETNFLIVFVGCRLPVELSCLMSMMPLHSAVASARLRSFLSIDSQSWSLVPQGHFYLFPAHTQTFSCIYVDL